MTKDNAYMLTKLLVSAYSAQKSVQEIPPESLEIYASFLMLLPIEIGQKAVMKLISNNKFFPALAEIKEAAKSFSQVDNQAPSAELAWAEVRKNLDPYKAPCWSHAVIEKAVRTMGYRNLCDSQNPGNDIVRFIKIYEAYCRYEDEKLDNEAISKVAESVIKKLPDTYMLC